MKPIEICCFYGITRLIDNPENQFIDWLGYSVTLGMKDRKNAVIWTLDSAYEDEHFELSKEQLNFLEAFKNVLEDRLIAFMTNPANKNINYYSLPDSELEKIFKKINA